MTEPDLTSSEEYRQIAELVPDDFSNPEDSLAEVRAKFEMAHGHDPGDGVVVAADPFGVWVRPATTPASPRPVVFFVHGGGFVTSTAESYAFYGANIARACDVDVFVAEYRLAPETIHPGQTEDLLSAYSHLLTTHDPATVFFMGDSCGGGMALSVLLAARDQGLDLPAGFVGLCGWFDLEASGESAVNPVGRDPFLNVEWLRLRARDYVGPDGDPASPEVSSIHADLAGIPPSLLHAGAIDRCRSDAETLGERMEAAGTQVEVEIWSGMPHGFHGLVGVAPEADAALAKVAGFIRYPLGS